MHDALNDTKSLDLGKMLTKFGDVVFSIEGGAGETSYYGVLDEFAQMNRVEMRNFKTLRDWAIEKCGGDAYEVPARMRLKSRDTVFVVFPVPIDEYENRVKALRNYTLAAKHDWRLDRAVGVAISASRR